MPCCASIPRGRNRRRSASLAAAPALLFTLASCRPAATASVAPTATATQTPRPTLTATMTPSSTPTLTPTPTPSATIDWTAPVPVAMTLEEGKAEVMRWIAAAVEPRIEWASYVRGDRIAAAIEASARSDRGEGRHPTWEYGLYVNYDDREDFAVRLYPELELLAKSRISDAAGLERTAARRAAWELLTSVQSDTVSALRTELQQKKLVQASKEEIVELLSEMLG